LPSRIARTFNAIGGAFMARTGRVGILETTGAKTGLRRRAPVGYIQRADGSLLIGSGSRENRGWTLNLRANPVARFSARGKTRTYRARLVADTERAAALADLKISMGSFAERADWGDLFVLSPEA
jgi:deazaflavin-dependent oxidoreductase (nitroreductase family)